MSRGGRIVPRSTSVDRGRWFAPDVRGTVARRARDGTTRRRRDGVSASPGPIVTERAGGVGPGATLVTRVAAGWRALTPVFALLLLGAWLIMGQQSDVLGAMHPEGCPSGRPADVQWSPLVRPMDETAARRGRSSPGTPISSAARCAG